MFASLGSSRARLLLSSCSWVLRRPSLSPLSLLFSSSTRRPNPVALVVPSSQSFEAKELGAKQDRITGKWAVDSDVFEREGRESFDKWLLLPKAAGEPTNHPPPNGDEGTIVFFDIETTGLPAKGLKFGSFWDFKELSKYESCRVVQISALTCKRSTLEVIETHDLVVRADNFLIPNHEFHGITLERSMKEGIPFQDAATRILGPLFKQADAIVAHNAAFDTNVLKSELFRYGLVDCLGTMERKPVICSMLQTQSIVKAPSKHNPRIVKPPSLKELYQFATGKSEMANAHNSLYDVINLHEAVKALVANNKFSFEAL